MALVLATGGNTGLKVAPLGKGAIEAVVAAVETFHCAAAGVLNAVVHGAAAAAGALNPKKRMMS